MKLSSISLYLHLKLISKNETNKIKAVLSNRGIFQTWLAKKSG